MQKTNISWADKTRNPVIGCSPCSPGCANCYAKDLHDKRHKAYLEGKKVPACYAEPFDKITVRQERLEEPMHLCKPATIFVWSMGDLFRPDVADEWISHVFNTATNCPKHTFMILTKQPERMLNYVLGLKGQWIDISDGSVSKIRNNIWLGVTVCNQDEADEKIPILLATPAAHRFVSIEPMLGGVDFLHTPCVGQHWDYLTGEYEGARERTTTSHLDLVICGGETGKNARPMHPDWVRSLRDQCKAADVPFHFKQWGEWLPVETQDRFDPYGWSGQDNDTYHDSQVQLCQPEEGVFADFVRVGSKRAGHLLDGVEYRAMPGD
ncbi:TPA: phage Gp37/Gp68 family protein [Candidatus Sumerlaeota bacterium]|nr:phage Gp37/Gp68 family protein [Candidatus Sumerlaeota bacterium]